LFLKKLIIILSNFDKLREREREREKRKKGPEGMV
jgi:hypothetical protein